MQTVCKFTELFVNDILMAKQRILFVSQEIAPYLPASENASLGRNLPQAMQQRKYEVRTFMPNFGAVNERRNQLHEVIRLSGINIPINDADHPLIIKVASMQPSRIQVYFVDNDDFFHKLDSDVDAVGSNRADNDERALFYARGTLETAGKLSWNPDFVHIAGWISGLVPMYLKRVFHDCPEFKKSKVIFSVLNGEPESPLDASLFDKLLEDGVPEKDVELLRTLPSDTSLLNRIGILYADAVVFNSTTPDTDMVRVVQERGIPCLILDPEADNTDRYHEFYQSLKATK